MATSTLSPQTSVSVKSASGLMTTPSFSPQLLVAFHVDLLEDVDEGFECEVDKYEADPWPSVLSQVRLVDDSRNHRPNCRGPDCNPLKKISRCEGDPLDRVG